MTSATYDFTTPDGLIRAVPDIIGGFPSEWLVFVGNDKNGHAMTAHHGLHPLPSFTVLQATVGALRLGGAEEMSIIAYTELPRSMREKLPMEREMGAISRAVHTAIPVIHTLLVTEGRYYSYSCQNEICCPSDGKPLPGVS